MKITLEKLKKSFRGVEALREIDLEIPDGSIAVVIGPSGSGKSTLLNLVAGLEKPDAGRIRFDGKDVTGLPAEKRNIGYVFQSYALFPHRTVAENVGFGISHQSAGEREETVGRLLEKFQISHLGKRFPSQLSGGEKQRTALARSLARRPELVLLDEPLSALDARLREELRRQLSYFLRDYGRTAVHVTHDRHEALALADMLVVMNEGRILQSGSPREVYERPSNRFVATFLGDASLVSTDVEAGTGTNVYGRFPLEEAASEERYWMVLRPEDFRLCDGGSIHLRVRSASYCGSHWLLEGLDQHGLSLKANLPAAGRQPHSGELITFDLDLLKPHFVSESSSIRGDFTHGHRANARN